MKFKLRFAGIVLTSGLLLALASCGGGSGGSSASSASGATATVSSGSITAFGSVFVNGHEFNTTNANVVDDDTGATTAGTSNLEVGMVVAVNSAAGSTKTTPVAADIHISPLARGFVEASDSTAGTITVMGQTVQLASGTAFSDHRACVTAVTSPCTATAGQGDLTATSGATPGTFVSIHGYLYSTGSSAQIVATLVSAGDYTAGTSRFKLEGQVTGVSATTLSIGAENVDLSKAVCRGATTVCSTAYAIGDIVAAHGLTAPAAGTFAADAARLSRMLPQTAGASVEVEGKVSSVSGTTFVIRGITVDGSGLATGQIPAVGDKVELLGTVVVNGTSTSIMATSIVHDVPAAATRVTLAGPLASVATGATSGTFVVTVLGQTAIVDATTHIADRTVSPPPTFNITNFDTYLQAKTPFIVVRTLVDSSGNLRAVGFDVVKAPLNNLVGVAGPADAAPTVGASSNTVLIHGVPVIYSPGTTLPVANEPIVQGSYILAAGALSTGNVDTTAVGGFLFALPKSSKDRGFHGF
jgi:hypothetical protein